jgi:hypothetical protein
MTCKEAIKKVIMPKRILIPTDEMNYWNFNISFLNKGEYDQTQMDVYPYQFDHLAGKCEELEELWREFCLENGFKQNSIIEITLVNGVYEMDDVVICRHCGRPEYYGEMRWLNGFCGCRRCYKSKWEDTNHMVYHYIEEDSYLFR